MNWKDIIKAYDPREAEKRIAEAQRAAGIRHRRTTGVRGSTFGRSSKQRVTGRGATKDEQKVNAFKNQFKVILDRIAGNSSDLINAEFLDATLGAVGEAAQLRKLNNYLKTIEIDPNAFATSGEIEEFLRDAIIIWNDIPFGRGGSNVGRHSDPGTAYINIKNQWDEIYQDYLE